MPSRRKSDQENTPAPISTNVPLPSSPSSGLENGDWFVVKRILRRRYHGPLRSLQYLVDWERDPVSGKIYAPSWVGMPATPPLLLLSVGGLESF